MENENEIIDSPIDTDSTENENTEPTIDLEIDSDEEVEALRKKVATLEAQKNHWRTKATEKKPEAIVTKEVSKAEAVPETLSQFDTIALITNNVTEKSDIELVQQYAKVTGVSIAEALKSSMLKGLIKEKAEERTVSLATNVGSKRTNSKVSNEVLLDKARNGDMPESDADLERLISARLGLK